MLRGIPARVGLPVTSFNFNMAQRSLRSRKTIDYNKLHTELAQQESDEEQDELALQVDEEGERELCGSFSEEQQGQDLDRFLDSEVEDGEVSLDSSEEEEDEIIQACIKKGDVEKLRRILKQRERRTVKNWYEK